MDGRAGVEGFIVKLRTHKLKGCRPGPPGSIWERGSRDMLRGLPENKCSGRFLWDHNGTLKESDRQQTFGWRICIVACNKAKWKYRYLIEIQVLPQKQPPTPTLYTVSRCFSPRPFCQVLGRGGGVGCWCPLGKFWRISIHGSGPPF